MLSLADGRLPVVDCRRRLSHHGSGGPSAPLECVEACHRGEAIREVVLSSNSSVICDACQHLIIECAREWPEDLPELVRLIEGVLPCLQNEVEAATKCTNTGHSRQECSWPCVDTKERYCRSEGDDDVEPAKP
ncbi:hypothetical protein HPB50_015938 [Hyalomma asiaticum]|uniref:Uncharacterized protein n=1 Tax=Hyalomma asiaticum TaxID=266040 RepID=A0ACB7RK69_HYAAI|nr:hypothetical protein HPB50_015938 [Hyalomma asiaticum]